MTDPTTQLAAGLAALGMDPKEAADYAESHRPTPPPVLDAIADTVLRYRPKPTSDAAKGRAKRAKKIAKAPRP